MRRNGTIEEINPIDCVVGDIIVLQAGDDIPTDSLMIDDTSNLPGWITTPAFPRTVRFVAATFSRRCASS